MKNVKEADMAGMCDTFCVETTKLVIAAVNW